jgi:hypothetical protein
VFVYRGGAHASSHPAFVLPGGPSVASYGDRLFSPGDLDGDGYPDLGVTGRWYGSGSVPVALVDVYSGGPGFGGRPRTRRIEPVPTGNAGPSAVSLPDLEGDGFRSLALGVAMDARVAPQAGAVRVLRIERYRFTSPTPDARVRPGDPVAVDWLGAEPARLEWSDDDGTWRPIAVRAGGRERNAFEFRVPESARGALRFRLSASDPKVRGETRSPAVTLVVPPVTR